MPKAESAEVVGAMLEAAGHAAARVGEPNGPGLQVDLHHNTSTGTTTAASYLTNVSYYACRGILFSAFYLQTS
jgi:hypothetical protein